MSTKDKVSEQTKKTRKESRQKRMVRAMCLFLAILMVLSCLTVLVYVFGGQWNVNAGSAYAYDNDLIAVGIIYGGDETVGFETSTTNGFVVNKTTIERSVRSTEPIYKLSLNDVSIVNDATLSKKSGEYVKYNGNTAAVGGYHLEIREKLVDQNGVIVPQKLKIASEAELKTLVTALEKKLADSAYAVIPSYIDDEFRVRIGDCSSMEKIEDLQKYLKDHTSITKEYNLAVVEPSSTGVSIVDPNLNQVLFEYDCGGFTHLGLSVQKEGEYLKTPDSRLYGGTLVYRRANGGIQVRSLINIEDYVKCVVPWEISASWNYNALTAFSIVVRTYAIRNKNGCFSKYGFDLYDTSSSQVYGGYTKVTNKVRQACDETRGKVVFYEGKLAELFYSSSTGGWVISNKDAWGSSPLPYLDTKETPWENYPDRGRGLWFQEISAKELAEYLRQTSACANLTSPIASAKINSTAGGSGYVTSITFVDTAGHTATVKGTSKAVKSALSKYTYSANFVIGKGSVNYTYNVINDIYLTEREDDGSIFVEQNPTYFDKFQLSDYNVLTSLNKKLAASGSSLSMITFGGRRTVTTKKANVLTSDRYHKLITDGVDVDNIYNIVPAADSATLQSQPVVAVENESKSVIVDYDIKTKTYTASNPDNFVIVGKGWGHGIGMSQWGVLDLANAGMKGNDIIATYFPGTVITNYK